MTCPFSNQALKKQTLNTIKKEREIRKHHREELDGKKKEEGQN